MKLRPAASRQARQEPQQQSKQTYEVTTCGLLAGATSTSGTKSSRLGMEHPGAAGSGEVKTWREGAVVESGAEAILNELGPKQPAYIPNWVGRVTWWSLAGAVSG